MLNYWWVTRPKRRLDSVPEVLAAFAELSLNQQWQGQRLSHIAYEDALEDAGLKRKGDRRDQGGSGGRTYAAWLESLGLIFKQESTGNIMLTLAGVAILDGDSPVSVLTNQIIKYQFPSAFSVSRGVKVSERFKIRPFRFLLKLLMDRRIGYLTQDEIAKIVIIEAENEAERCYEHVVDRVLKFRSYGDSTLDKDFVIKYGPSRGAVNPDCPYRHLEDCANTIENWLEYTQLCHRVDGKLIVLDDKREEVVTILSKPMPFIDRPEQHEYYQRKYGLDPKHKKDLRDLTKSKTITARIMLENKIRAAYISLAIKQPILSVTSEVVDSIAENTGAERNIVEEYLQRVYPNGSIGAFMTSYFEMAFKGTEEAVEFEKATTDIFRDVFRYSAKHLGQTGSKSAPDILLISDAEGYQAVVDNKAYSKYSITGDHHNRMVHNYIEKISNYSSSTYPVGFFLYIAGGFINTIDKQLQKEVEESGVNGAGISVSNFIKMIERAQVEPYTHKQLREIFGLNRQVLLSDIKHDTAVNYKLYENKQQYCNAAEEVCFGEDE